MKRVVITGGTGFVGGAVICELLQNDVEIWAIVRPGDSRRKSRRHLEKLPVHVVECDLREIKSLPGKFMERGFDVWYQFAWDGLFGENLLDYHQQIANVEWTMDAICTASKLGCQKFIGSGSISQYELEISNELVSSGDKHRFYKAAKWMCDYMGRSVAATYGISYIWPIITNIYGVGEESPRLINSMIRNLQEGKHQALSNGNQFYDFIYITDAAKAFRLIGESGRQNRNYVIGSGKAQPLKNFLNVLRNAVAPDASLGFGELEFNGFYLPLEKYCISTLQEDTGFIPKVSFEEGIRRTAAWTLQA